MMINRTPIIKNPKYACPNHVPISKATPIKKKTITKKRSVNKNIDVIKVDKNPETLFTVLSFNKSILVSP